MREVVLCGAVRTAIGKFGGALAGIPAAELGAVVIKAALARTGIPSKQVDQVIMGNVLATGQGQNPARQSSIAAGLPVEAPAMTINRVCGSGLEAVSLAAALIRAGEADIVVAGGMENMSAAPYALPKARFGYRMGGGELMDTMIHDALWDAFGQYHMGVTAENVAQEYGITREQQDAFAAHSQQKCEAAWETGRFDDEIVPVPVKTKKQTLLFDRDEYPRAGVTAEGLARLKPAFQPNGGTVTAANASGINDGAAAVVVMSADKARELGVKPMASYVAGAAVGVDPAIMGVGPAASTKKVLEWDAARVNVNGGAIALGHPVGASGARILVTLLHEMARRQSRYGLATLCVGGGMGVSAIVEGIGR